MAQVTAQDTTAIADELGTGLRGEVIDARHPSYEQTRRSLLFNGMHDRHPAIIARCTCAADVQAALACARSNGLTVAVRGGGHSTPGYSSCDGGIVVDTSPIKAIEIDAEAREGRFGAGLTWAELDAATQDHGLAVTGGRISHTGIAGFTLGSGSGWLERKHGMAAASLLSAELVTAEGRLVTADGERNPELLWGLKGGAGNFGVVTQFHFRLHPVGPLVYGGLILHPAAVAAELIGAYRDFMAGAPDEVGGAVALITAPPEEFIPEEVRGQRACAVLVFHAGDPADGPAAFRPMLEWGQPWLVQVGPMPYASFQQLLDGGFPWGIRNYSKSDYLRELPDAAIDEMVELGSLSASPFSAVILCPLGGAVARMDPEAMALNIPDTDWMYLCEAVSWDERQQEAEVEWARRFHDAMRPWSVGHALPNFLEPDEGARRVRASFGEEKLSRLVSLKDRYDPGNLFSLNVNVAPSGARGVPEG